MSRCAGWAAQLTDWLSSELGPQPRRYSVIHNAAQMPKDSALSLGSQTLRDSLELATIVPAEINRMIYPSVRVLKHILTLFCDHFSGRHFGSISLFWGTVVHYYGSIFAEVEAFS